MQPARAVLKHKLEHGLRAVPESLEPLGDDAPSSRGRLAGLELPDSPQMPSVFLAPGPMQQQILDADQAQPGQLRRPLDSDARQFLERS